MGHTVPTASHKSNRKIPNRLVVIMSWFLFLFFSVLVSPTIKINGFGAQEHVRKSRNHRDEGIEGSHISKSENYKFKLEQNTTELLSISFP